MERIPKDIIDTFEHDCDLRSKGDYEQHHLYCYCAQETVNGPIRRFRHRYKVNGSKLSAAEGQRALPAQESLTPATRLTRRPLGAIERNRQECDSHNYP